MTTEPKTIVLPELPRSDSREAAAAIEELMRQRNYPCNPQAAARVGFEACRRISFRQRLFGLAAQAAAGSDLPASQIPYLRTQVDFWSTEHAKARLSEMAMREDVRRLQERNEQLLRERHRALALCEAIDESLASTGVRPSHRVRVLLAQRVRPFQEEFFPPTGEVPDKAPADPKEPHLERASNRDFLLIQNGETIGNLPAGSPVWAAVKKACTDGFIPPVKVEAETA